jgi:hypothetical protein
MISTFQALAVAAIALLPGAMYVWGFEATVGGRWGVQLADRIPRFFGYSAIFHALLSPATYWLYANYYIRPKHVEEGRPLPLWLWAVAIGYVVVPYVTGRVLGAGAQKERRWATLLTGTAHAPRAWDDLLSRQPVAWVRIKLKSDPWIGGAFALDRHGRRSYAAGYPHEQDLYLAEQAEVDPETGDFQLDDDGNVVLLGRGVLLRWSEIEYLTFTEAEW